MSSEADIVLPSRPTNASVTAAITAAINAAISGTTNTVPKFTSANVIGNSSITDNGSNVSTLETVSIGTATPVFTLTIFNSTDSRVITRFDGAQTNAVSGFSARDTTTSSGIFIQSANGTGKQYTGTNDGDAELGAIGSHNLIFGTNGVARMRIDSSGNVGIGTTTISDIIDVRKNQNATTNFYFRNTDTTNTTSRAILNLIGGDVTMQMECIHGDNAYLIGTAGRKMQFQVSPGGTVGMTMDSGALIGIGTPSPLCHLDVRSTADSDGVFTLASVAGNLQSMLMAGDTSVGAFIAGALSPSGTNSGNTGDGAGRIIMQGGSTNGLQFQTSAGVNNGSARSWTTRMILLNSGKFGIGVSPTRVLHVNGDTEVSSASATGLIYLGSDTGSYVYRNAGVLNFQCGSGEKIFIGGGNVGIETSTAAAKLHVFATVSRTLQVDSNAAAGPYMTFDKSGADKFYIGENSAVSGVGFTSYNLYAVSGYGIACYTDAFSTSAKVFCMDANGKFGIGTNSPGHQLELSLDDAYKPTTALWGILSDSRVKDVKDDFTHGLDIVNAISPIYYSYKEGNHINQPTDKTHSGLIAQDIQKVLPECVRVDSKGYLNLHLDPLLYAMLNAIKELSEKVSRLESLQ